MSNHAELAQSEGDEDTEDVQLDQGGDIGLVDDDENHREAGQSQDAVAEGKSVTARVQLARQVAILGQDRPENRETVEGGVRCQGQDQGSRQRDDQHCDGEVAEDRVRHLNDDRLLRLSRRKTDQIGILLSDMHIGLQSQPRDAGEHGHRDDAEQKEHSRRILRLGRLEGRHSIGHGLDARQGSRA